MAEFRCAGGIKPRGGLIYEEQARIAYKSGTQSCKALYIRGEPAYKTTVLGR